MVEEVVKNDTPAAVDGEAIVVIDDDYVIRLSCRQTLAKSGYQVETHEDGAAGLEAAARLRPAMVVVDLKMPGISGLDVIERVHAIDANIVVVVITGYATISTAVDAMKAGAYDFLPKPFKPDQLRMIVKRGIERRRLLLESRRAEMERELLKRRFVTFVSHQLKTPLVAIHQYLDVMRRMEDNGTTKPQRREWLDKCLKRTGEMSRLIEDWLTLSSVESGALARASEPIDVAAVVGDVVRSYDVVAEQARVGIELDLGFDRCMIRGDRSCLTVLFDNLIDNAIKYNRDGGTVKVTGEIDGGDAAIHVADSGIGVASEHLPFLFDEFYRVRGSDERKTAGTGLGLPICRRIATELGGRIEVESTAGVGTMFSVTLPLIQSDEHAPESGRATESESHDQDTDS